MEPEELTCKQCGKEFNYKNGLLRHQKLTHAKERKYECEICNRRFGYKNILLEHQNIHFGIKPYKCSLCDKRFAARSNLVQHRTVHKRPLSCTVCPQRFLSEDALQRHIKGHQGTVLSCNLCSFSTPNQITLNDHIHTSHATELNKQKAFVSTPGNYDRKQLRRRSSSRQQAFDPDSLPTFKQDFQHPIADDAIIHNAPFSAVSQSNSENVIIKAEPMSPKIDMYLHNAESTSAIESVQKDNPVLNFSDIHSVSDDRVSTPRSYSSQSREGGIADSTSGLAEVLARIHTCIRSSEELNARTIPRLSINVDPPRHTRDFSSQFTSERSDIPSVREIMSYLEAQGKIFRCHHCCIMFEDRGLYILHTSLHGQSNPWQCNVCNKLCLNKNDFHLHQANQQHE
ncbi:uncharacterized protein LOC143057795 [Mytilus galloprovincialis]|uniref:C2H2-type domain-containing protein n=1 Tax=Mytilus edulis TaxID=6550 RepID=A0A8S3Q417_MYTED|nr:unnamed protein product [Mytilus edulis]